LRRLQEIQPFLMEEDCGGGQGLSWAVEPRREREKLKFAWHNNRGRFIFEYVGNHEGN
jgi:hypothetical protein